MNLSVLLAALPAPRSRQGLYSGAEIAFLVLSGLAAGEKDLVSIAEWGEDNLD
jgi:hypothetical protein